MRTDYLEEFVTLAETLNFTEAAERSYVTQPALSKHIATMERELGVKLFARDRRSVALTEAGEALLEDACEAVGCFHQMRRTARRYRSDGEGVLAIGYLRGVAENAIPAVHRAFTRGHLAVDISYKPFSYNELIDAMNRGKADVAVGIAPTWRGGDLDERFDRALLFEDRLCAVASEEHPLTKRPNESLTARDLANETILSLPSSAPFSDRDNLVEYFKEAGVEVTFLDRFDSLERLPLQLITENCIAFLPSHLEFYFNEMHLGKFSFTPMSDYPGPERFYLYWKRENELAASFAHELLGRFRSPKTKELA